jgi:hypothetical protein
MLKLNCHHPCPGTERRAGTVHASGVPHLCNIFGNVDSNMSYTRSRFASSSLNRAAHARPATRTPVEAIRPNNVS